MKLTDFVPDFWNEEPLVLPGLRPPSANGQHRYAGWNRLPRRPQAVPKGKGEWARWMKVAELGLSVLIFLGGAAVLLFLLLTIPAGQ